MSIGKILLLLIMDDLHCEQMGTSLNEKLSRIHPLHPSFVQDQMAVISSGKFSSGLFHEYDNETFLLMLQFIKPTHVAFIKKSPNDRFVRGSL